MPKQPIPSEPAEPASSSNPASSSKISHPASSGKISRPPSASPEATVVNAEVDGVVPSSGNWSASIQSVLDQPTPSFPFKIMLGGVLFCLAFGVWATLGEIDEIGHSQGRLAPKGETFKIHPIDLGKVASIQITEGQAVKAGQVLVELDTELAKSEVDRLQQLLSAAQLELIEKKSLIERTAMEGQTRSAIATADTQGQQAAIAQAEAKIATLAKQITQQEAAKAASEARLNTLRPLVEQGSLSKETVFQAEQNLRERTLAITQTQGELAQTKEEIVRLRAGLDQKAAEGNTTKLQTQQRVQQLQLEVTQMQAKIAENQNLINSAKAKLKQRFIYSPVSGTVTSMQVGHIGEVVQPGQTLAEIAPQDSPLILLASLPDREAGFVKKGMSVQVKFDAFPYQDYGIISGKVVGISLDAKQDKQLGAVYEVRVELERNYVTANQKTIQFKAGQTATADIVLRRRRIVDLLLDPFKQLQKGGVTL